MPKDPIDHNAQVRVANVIHDRAVEYGAWYHRMYKAIRKAHPYPVERYIRFFKDKLGRQDTCVVFRHRNWVWTDPEAGWTLYVDKRGPALHVHRDLTPDKAWEAICAFADRIDVPMVEKAE